LWLQCSEGTGAHWAEIDPRSPLFLYVPTDYSLKSEYDRGVSLAEALGIGSDGILTGRDALAVGFTRDELISRVELFRDSTGDTERICRQLGISSVSPRFDPAECRSALRRVRDLKPFIVPLQYRPFDYRWLFYFKGLVEMMRPRVTLQFTIPGNVAIAMTRQVNRPQYEHALMSRVMVEKKTVSHDRNTRVFPLLVGETSPESSLLPDRISANWRPKFVALWREQLGTDITGPENARLALHYIYGVLYSPTYRERYLSFLRSDFPRVIVTHDAELVMRLAALGADLAGVHTLDPDYAWSSWRIAGDPTRSPFCRLPPRVEGQGRDVPSGFPRHTPDGIWVNSSLCFPGVKESVYAFHIGGYQVCHKWLKDRRGRVLSDDDITHYQKIIVAISETIRIMGEIDNVIEEHGGWPDAFATKTDKGKGKQ
jgi:hypothetical protein